MDTATTETRTDGVIVFNGREWMSDAKGSLVPVTMVKAQHKLEDELVRGIMQHANDLNAQISRFKAHTNADLASYDSLIAQEYGAKIGGPKGNRTYQRFDGLAKIEVKVADLVDFGPELQVAKTLIDECLNEWSVGSRPEIQSIVTRAFNTDQEGKINRSEIYMLLRHEIDDDRWKRAMEAIVAAMRITGSKEYIRFYQRASIEDGWTAVTIDMAKA